MSLTRKSGHQTGILLHGNLIHTRTDDWAAIAFSESALQHIIRSAIKPLLFLASPFVHSFVHETIHLSASEMEKADRQILGFANMPPSYLNMTSIRLNEKKSLTVHSHLTKAGTRLLNNLRANKTGVSWLPAISSFITNIHQDSSLSAGENLRIFLGEEVLQVKGKLSQLRFQHLNYLRTRQSFEEKQRTTEQILEQAEGQQEYSVLILGEGEHPALLQPDVSVDLLLKPPPKNRSIKSVTRRQKKRQLDLRFLLKRNHMLGLATSLVVIWALIINFHTASVNHDRLSRSRQVADLQQQSIRLNEIAEAERSQIRFSSIRQTVRQLVLQPADYLTVLNRHLPEGVWVQQITIRDDRISLTLLDSGETELSALMDRLGRQYGTTTLKSSEGITLDKIPVRRYAIEITQLVPGS